MSFDPVPWFTGGGAQHSPEVARLLAYAATGGAEGVISPGDLKVAPLDVPGSSVRVLSGAFSALNKAAGGSQQTYVGRNPTEDPVAISATGSAAGRSDLIVARIEDPFMPGEPWADPADVTVGPYVFSRVIPNVPSSAIVNNASATDYLATLGYSAIPLAAVTLPASTATITAGMIKDLRKLARPRTWNDFDVQAGVDVIPIGGGAAESDRLLVTDTDWHNWPKNAFNVTIPKWATHAQVSIQLIGVETIGPADAETRVQLGSLFGSVIAAIDYNGNPGTPVGYVENLTHFTFAEFDVRALQGTAQAIRLSARRTWPQNTGDMMIGSRQQVVFDVRFRELTV